MRLAKVEVRRQRLKYNEHFLPIRKTAQSQPSWFTLALDLALINGQRREDIARMEFSHIYDGRLHVVQIKTGARIALPLTLTLRAAGLILGEVIERSLSVRKSGFLISAGPRKNTPDGSLHPDGLTKRFVRARNEAGLALGDNPPTFHEIRSLSGRMYEKERGKEFAQMLPGHTSEKMTKKYLDTRDKKFTLL